MPHDHAFIMR